MLMTALFIGVNLRAQSPPTNGLTSYYPFDGNADDVVGGENGVVTNALLTNNMFGIPTNAYWFSSQSNSVIAVPDSTVNNLNSGTIAAWVELDSNAEGVIFSKQHTGINTMAFFSVGYYPATGGLLTPGQLYFHAYNGAPDVLSSTYLSTGVWYHVAVTFSSTNCAIYVNGNLSTNMAGNFSIPYDVPVTLTAIGAWWRDGTFVGLNGRLTHVRIYNQALSTNDVAQLYAAESVPPLQITQDSTNIYVVYGATTNLSLAASGPGPISYQWYFVPANNAGQAGAYAETINGFVYGAVVTNGGFGYGNVPHAGFAGGGGIGAAGYCVVSNGSVVDITMTNAGSGYSNLPTVLIDPPDGLLPGQTNTTLVISNAGLNNLGNYHLVVSNSNAIVSSSVVNLTLLYPPSINTNPVGFTQDYRSTGNLGVVAAGTQPLSYQWSLNGTNIAGATNSSYVIASLTLAETGAYVVDVANPYGYVYSSPAEVYLAPALISPFTGADALWGQDTTLGVGAIGSGTLDYQWYFNGVAIPGATSDDYVLDDIQFTNAGLYSVVVSSPYGSVTNAAYQVVINPANISLGTFPGVYITGTVGYSYTIQSSTNLADTNAWVTLTNITIPTPSYIWVDISTDTTKPGNPMKFYRALPGQ